MGRIINIIKDPHLCTWNNGTDEEPLNFPASFLYRGFAENDKGEISILHFQDEVGIKECTGFDDMTESAGEGLKERFDYSITPDDLINFLDAINEMEGNNNLESNIRSLVKTFEESHLDISRILCTAIKGLYESRKEHHPTE